MAARARHNAYEGAMSDFILSAARATYLPQLPLSGGELLFMSQQIGGEWKTVVVEYGEFASGFVTAGQLTAFSAQVNQALADKAGRQHEHAPGDLPWLSQLLQGYAATGHIHQIGQVAGLVAALEGKASSTHGHDIDRIAGLAGALAGKSDNGHGHQIGDVNGLPAALAGKLGKTGGTITGTLTVNGMITSFAGFNWVDGSSLALKDIEGVNPYGLSEIRRIVTLVGKYKADYLDDGRRRLFFDYDNLRAVVPEAVEHEAVEYQGRCYGGVRPDVLIPVLVRAVDDLAGLVSEQQAHIDAMREGLHAMASRLDELERSK